MLVPSYSDTQKIAAFAAAQPPKKTTTDKLNNIFGLIKRGADTAKSVKDTIIKPGASPSTQVQQPMPQKKETDWAKIALWAGGLALGAIVLVKGAKYLKKKKGLGELNTAKTKKGRIKQRIVVMGKLAEEGKLFPKNKKGVRTKPRKSVKRKAKKTTKARKASKVKTVRI